MDLLRCDFHLCSLNQRVPATSKQKQAKEMSLLLSNKIHFTILNISKALKDYMEPSK